MSLFCQNWLSEADNGEKSGKGDRKEERICLDWVHVRIVSDDELERDR
jgi:hypothetical protein